MNTYKFSVAQNSIWNIGNFQIKMKLDEQWLSILHLC